MNTPRKAPSSNKGSVNSQVSDLILSVLNAAEKKPENKGKNKFEVLKKFLDDYSINGNCGLIEDISKISNISFDMIKDDGFDIGQIIGDDKNTSSSTLHIILNSPSLGTIGKDLEKIVISELTKKAKSKVPSGLQSKFDQEMNGANTLNDLKKQIRNFLEFGGIDDNTKNEIKKVKITNKDMVDGLVRDGKIQAGDIAGDYKNWNDSYKKSFDKIVTQEYVDGLKDSANFVEKNINMIKDTFTNFVPNMGRIFDKYPYDIEKIKKEEPEIAKHLEELQEKGDHENFNKACFYAYIGTIKDKKIGNILDKLFQNKFDFNKLDKNEQNDLLRDVVDSRLQELKKEGIADLLEVDYNKFEGFVKDIFDMDKNEVTIPCVGGDIKLGINKKFKGGENKNLADINNFAESKLPIEFDIKISGDNKDLIDNSALKYVFADEISDDGKSINLDGNNIGKLLLMYKLGEASFDKKNMSPEKVQKLEKLIDVMNEKKKLNETDEKNRGKEEDDGEDLEAGKNGEGETGSKTQEEKEKHEDEFFNAWKKIKGHEFSKDKEKFGFVNGTRLWIKLGETELPPVNVGGDLWVQMEIIDIGEKDFKVKITGGELASEKYEGKVISYPKTKDSIDMISNAFNGDVYKLPNPEKWEESLGSIKGAGLSNLQGLNFFDEIKYEKGKFISNIEKDEKNNGKEITHFGTDEKTYDDNGKEKTKPVFYKITHNNNGTITLEYENYKREMDYNNFIIFVSTKQLKPATKDHVEENIKNYDNEAKASLGGRKRQFFGWENIKGGALGIYKKFNESVKKYSDERTDAFNEFLVSDVRIFQKLTSITSFIPGVGNALQGAELEYYNERDGKVWKKIDKWIKIFEADPDFGESFGIPSYLKPYLGETTLKDMVISGKQPKDPYIAAATLIALIGKGKSPYRGIDGYKMKGLWVKLLLGESHQARFLEHQKELVRQIQNEKGIYGSSYDAQMTNDLVRAEMTYLVNNIGGRATGQRFGSMKDDNGPKKMWSDKFAGELDTKYNEWVSQSKIDEEYNKAKHVTNFTFAYNEFKRFSGSGRSMQALVYIKKMATLAKSPQQIDILKMSLIGCMVNGFFLNFADKDTKGWLQSICRSMGFAPGLRVTAYDQKEKTAYMLDYISQGEFSKDSNMKYNINNFGIEAKEAVKYSGFFGEFEKWWNKQKSEGKSNGQNIGEFLKKLPIMEEYKGKKIADDHIMSDLKSLSIESQVEQTDKDVDTNSKIVTDSPLSQTKGLIQQKMLKYDNGTFSGDIDQIQASEDFWNEVSKQISKGVSSKKELEDIAKIFFNRFDGIFDESGKINFIRRLATIQKYTNAMGTSGNYKQEGGGSVNKKDMRNVMRYSTVGEVCRSGRNPPSQLSSALEAFLKVFWDNEKFFDKEMIKSVFGKEYLEHFDKPYKFVPWNAYNDISGGFGDMDFGGYYGEDGAIEEYENEKSLSKEQKQDRANKRKQFRNDDIFLNKKLKDLERDLNRKGVLTPSLGLGIGDINKDKSIVGYR